MPISYTYLASQLSVVALFSSHQQHQIADILVENSD
jgi:hypothetical protein